MSFVRTKFPGDFVTITYDRVYKSYYAVDTLSSTKLRLGGAQKSCGCGVIISYPGVCFTFDSPSLELVFVLTCDGKLGYVWSTCLNK